MSQPDADFDYTKLVLLQLAMVAAVVVLMRHNLREKDDQLRIEHGRREEAERRLHQREEQLDGALEEIHRRKTNGDDEPTPVPTD